MNLRGISIASCCLFCLLLLVDRANSETIVVESDNGEKHAIFIPHVKFNQKKLEELKNRNRDPKQFIGASVQSSIAVVNDDDPEYMKQRYQKEYERASQESRQGSSPATTPKFKFYLYDDDGTLVQENLSLHDIQQILLIQSKSFGLSQLQWLIGRNLTLPMMTSSRPTSTPPTQTTLASMVNELSSSVYNNDGKTRRVTSSPDTTEPHLSTHTNHDRTDPNQVLNVIDLVQNIVASAQEESQRPSSTTTTETIATTTTITTTTTTTTTTLTTVGVSDLATTTTTTLRKTTQEALTPSLLKQPFHSNKNKNHLTTSSKAPVVSSTTRPLIITARPPTKWTYSDEKLSSLLTTISDMYNEVESLPKLGTMKTKPPSLMNRKSSINTQPPYALTRFAEMTIGNINPPQFPSPTSIENENNEVSPAPYARTTESVPDTTHNGTWSWMDVTKREQLANMPVSSSFNPIRGPMLPQITAKDLITDLVSRRPSPTVPMSTFSITRTKLPSEGFELQDESATEFGPLQTFQQVTSKNGQILFTSQSLSTNFGGTGPQTVPTIPTESDSPSMNENQIEDHEHHPNHDESHHHDHDHHHEHGDHDHGHNHEHDSHGHGHKGHEHDHSHHDHHDHDHHFTPSNLPKVALPQGPSESLGLTASTSHLTRAERAFVDVNNNLGFQFYRNLLKEHGQENMVFSPISTSTSLAMIFLGSRGNTSWQLNEILRLDEMISFNPHLMFKNITDTLAESTESITSACLKALLVDKKEDPLMEFYKARARYFYNGLIENVDYDNIEEEIRELINQMIFMKTNKLVKEFLGHEHPHPAGPMSFFGANFFQGKFDIQGDTEEMNFINLPRARRLVSVPSIKQQARLNACYHRGMDVSALEIPYSDPALSLILILPGKQTEFIAGGLQKIESKLNVENWNELMTAFLPLELDIQVPIFQHRSMLDLSDAVKNLGAKYAFDADKGDFTGINGGLDLYLSSILQLNEFRFDSVSKNEELDQDTNESEKEPKSPLWDLFGLSRNGRQTEDESQRFQLRFDRQFLYVVRHTYSGMILYMGRYYQPESADGSHGHHSHHDHHNDDHDHEHDHHDH